MDKLTIRSRQRVGRTRESGWSHTTWHEYQVVEGRKIIGRFDTRDQAEAFLAGRRALAADSGETTE